MDKKVYCDGQEREMRFDHVTAIMSAIEDFRNLCTAFLEDDVQYMGTKREKV